MEIRKAKRDCMCRGCDEVIKRDTELAFFTYSWRNQGQPIMFCKRCVVKIGGMFGLAPDAEDGPWADGWEERSGLC